MFEKAFINSIRIYQVKPSYQNNNIDGHGSGRQSKV
jgi:hypothetical protein